jgi:ribosome biogenesis protein Nip4
MEAKSILGGFFKNTSFRIFFLGLVALSPAKVKKIMANRENSYGADLPQTCHIFISL